MKWTELRDLQENERRFVLTLSFTRKAVVTWVRKLLRKIRRRNDVQME